MLMKRLGWSLIPDPQRSQLSISKRMRASGGLLEIEIDRRRKVEMKTSLSISSLALRETVIPVISND